MSNPEAQSEVASSRVALFVLGMHRSGTSMLSGLLQELGCAGPQTQMEANEWNEKGYFESIPIFRLNDQILASAGSRWDDWRPIKADWRYSEAHQGFGNRANALLEEEYGGRDLINLKDPRYCRLLPFWASVVENAGYRVACLHTHRNPAEVADSLHRRNGMPRSLSVLIWLRHVLDAEMNSRDLPRMFTSYDAVLEDWQPFVQRGRTLLGFDWPGFDEESEATIRAMVDGQLRHHVSNVKAFLQDPAVPVLVKRTLHVLESWAKDGEEPEGRAELDRVRAEFDQSAGLFAAPVSEMEELSTEKIRILKKYVSGLTKKLTAREEEQAETESKVASLEAELAAVSESLQASRQETAAKAEQASDAETEAEAMKTELAEVLQRLDESMRDAATREDRLKDTRARIDALEAALSKASKDLEERAQEIIARDTQLQEVQSRYDALETELAAATRRFDESESAARLGESHTDYTQSKVAALEAEVAALTQQLEESAERAAGRDNSIAKRDGAIAKRDSTIDKLHAMLGNSASRLETMRAKLTDAQANLNASQKKLEITQKKVADIAELFSGSKQKLATVAARRDELKAECSQSKKEVAQLRQALNEKEKELAELLAHHERESEALRLAFVNSASWKMTKPVRVIGRLVRRGR